MLHVRKSRIALEIMSCGRIFEINEGDLVLDLIYYNHEIHDEVCISGRVRSVEAQLDRSSGCRGDDYPLDFHMSDHVHPTRLLIDHSREGFGLFSWIRLDDIISIGDVINHWYRPDATLCGTTRQFMALDRLVSEASPGEHIRLLPGEYSSPLRIRRSMTIEGVGANATITGRLTIQGSGELRVTLRNLVFSRQSGVVIEGGGSVCIEGCVFERLDGVESCIRASGPDPLLLEINSNHFRTSPESPEHCLDCSAPAADHSCFFGNVFDYGCCSSDQILLRGAIPDGRPSYHLVGNEYAESENGLRIDLEDNPEFRLIVSDNLCHDGVHGEDADRAPGLFVIRTTSPHPDLSGVVIVGERNTLFDGEDIGYVLLSSAGELPADNCPRVNILRQGDEKPISELPVYTGDV